MREQIMQYNLKNPGPPERKEKDEDRKDPPQPATLPDPKAKSVITTPI